jgi:hypothetical protein
MHNFDYIAPKGRVERWQVIVQNELAGTGDRATTCCYDRCADTESRAILQEERAKSIGNRYHRIEHR